jgi:outer membrane protein TolC
VILALLLAVQVSGGDSLPRITLREALERSARLDPNYVRALGGVDNAEWGRVAALTAFVVPTLTASTDITRADQPLFNFGTGTALKKSSSATLTARLDLFTGGQKLAGWRQARAQLEAAQATEAQARFASALLTESDYYAALAAEELTRVTTNRVRRAEEQLTIARARVQSGAAVQTDSLQLLLELSRAQVDSLRQHSTLRNARLELGRRVGLPIGAEPVPLDTVAAQPLPFSFDDAVRRALAQGPAYRIARANERSAQAQLFGRRGSYLPRASLTMTKSAFDSTFFPSLVNRTLFTLTVSLPIWDGAQREIALSQARVNRDVARAIREDLERAGRRDVGVAYDAYETARAQFALNTSALAVARENFRVQDTRYRSGATTILDLLDAQFSLTQAEADLVQARFTTRLALAALEAMLGERLFSQDNQ